MNRKSKPAGKARDGEGLWDKVRKTATPLADRDRFHSQFVEFLNDQANPRTNPSPRDPVSTKLKPAVPEKNATDAALPWPKGTILRPQGKPFPYQPSPSSTSPALSKSATGLAQNLDEATAKKIRKGRISIDAVLDLHGMTQIEAHQRLFRFLESAQKMNNRVILVITGKGNAGEGVLRRAVPQWLEEGPFRHLVSGYRSAHQVHGGSGALYVRVRRGMRSD